LEHSVLNPALFPTWCGKCTYSGGPWTKSNSQSLDKWVRAVSPQASTRVGTFPLLVT